MTPDIDGLAASCRGAILRPEDDGYDDARAIWNGAIDRRPSVIVRCAGPDDVREAIRFARTHDLPVAVRAGGHGVAGTALCDDGLVIDLSAMKGMQVDAHAHTARAEPGLLWGEFDQETQACGLATPGGVITHTGISGLTLGGGIGWLMRKHGLTCDNLVSCDVVTADGDLVRASGEENAELFWGLKGGGGNFGVVTNFEYRLHPVGPQVLAGLVLHPAERAAEVLRFYRDYVAAAPDELTTIVYLRHAPPAPFLPQELHGRPVIMIGVCYAGDLEEGERVLAPFRAHGEPLIDLIEPRPYVDHQGTLDASVPHGLHYYWKADYLPPLSDAVIDTLVAHAWKAPSLASYTILFHLGGAIRDLDSGAAAFEDRNAEHALNINSVWTGSERPEEQIAWSRNFFEAVHPHSTGGSYMNFLGEEGEDRIRAAYGATKYERLRALKTEYDPENLFRFNQNIRPLS
ncbi:MAG: FAD-binding oxidoreductase [Alphaproteobacteria bacterium]